MPSLTFELLTGEGQHAYKLIGESVGELSMTVECRHIMLRFVFLKQRAENVS
jgi:hypothetical protein